MRKLILLITMIIFFYDIVSANAPNFVTTSLEDNNEETLQLLSASTDEKSAKIFSENCSSCHSGGVPRAPHSTTFQVMSPEYILSTLNGVMASQSEGLTQDEKIKLAEYITGGKVSQNLAEPNFCKANINDIQLKEEGGFFQWGYDEQNSRNPKSNITSKNVKNIKLKWVFAYPSASRARSQPSISGNTVFVGGQNLFLYALDRDTGCVRWRTKVEGEIRSAPAIYFSKNDEGWISRIKDAGLLAHVYQHEESRILAVMVRFLGKNLVVGKHDAVVIKEYGGSLVDQLRNQIRNDLGYELEFGRRNLAGAGCA